MEEKDNKSNYIYILIPIGLLLILLVFIYLSRKKDNSSLSPRLRPNLEYDTLKQRRRLGQRARQYTPISILNPSLKPNEYLFTKSLFKKFPIGKSPTKKEISKSIKDRIKQKKNDEYFHDLINIDTFKINNKNVIDFIKKLSYLDFPPNIDQIIITFLTEAKHEIDKCKITGNFGKQNVQVIQIKLNSITQQQLKIRSQYLYIYLLSNVNPPCIVLSNKNIYNIKKFNFNNILGYHFYVNV